MSETSPFVDPDFTAEMMLPMKLKPRVIGVVIMMIGVTLVLINNRLRRNVIDWTSDKEFPHYSLLGASAKGSAQLRYGVNNHYGKYNPIMMNGNPGAQTGMARHGLEARDDWFWINGMKTRLFSGAMHYFRIPKGYWRDRMIKLRSSGCNVLETYVPWNLHEPQRGVYNFKDLVDLRAYVRLAEECGLFVIVRPGPFIGSEWELGGLPSWLLSDPKMKLRSTYQPFMDAVKSYFKELLSHVTDLQYSSGGGPIIAWQIENEYGNFGNHKPYLRQIQQIMKDSGCTELMFTSDNPSGIDKGSVEGVLMTANFQQISQGKRVLPELQTKQPGMPKMCMEFWDGWYDRWSYSHSVLPYGEFVNSLNYTLEEFGSINFYMFHGGTNFAFMNGANERTPEDKRYIPAVTSYDYDALLTERGDITRKYETAVKLMAKYKSQVLYLGDIPTDSQPLPSPHKYDDVVLTSGLSMNSVLNSAVSLEVKGKAVAMEMLPVNNGNGQAYGWTLYRKKVEHGGKVKIFGRVRDRTLVYLNQKLVSTFDCNTNDFQFQLASGGVLDILVENMGRVSFQPPNTNIMSTQRKGLNNKVMIEDEVIADWSVYCIDFSEVHLARLKSEEFIKAGEISRGPAILQGHLEVTSSFPADTYIDMKGWGKGIVILNGRNLGRYWPSVGPTKTLYLPGVWLNKGDNEFMVFELEDIPLDKRLKFSSTPKLG